MNKDKIKKTILYISVIIALVLFFFIYKNSSNEVLSNPYDIDIKVNKSLYLNYNPGEVTDVYINVFPTKNKEGNLYDFSSFDITANWDKENNPKLDANVQFVTSNKEANLYQMRSPNASIRVRGNRGSALKSYRIKLIDGAYWGQSVFNINKNLRDPSRIANKLAHDLIKDIDHIYGFRTNFLRVYIRDDKQEGDFVPYGLYTHIEQPNKAYLKARGLDVAGSIYRAENFDFQLTKELKNVDDPLYNKEAFETVLSIREGKEHSKLIKMLKDINDENKEFNQLFHSYFHEENYLTWLSINILLGNVDAMSCGFLLYNPSDSSMWYLLPWDFDGIFLWMEEDEDMPSILDKLRDVNLHRRYLEQEGNLRKLHDKIEELISESFSPNKIKALKKTYKPILLEMMNKYPDNLLLNIPMVEYMAYIDQIDEKIYRNYQEFLKWYEVYSYK